MASDILMRAPALAALALAIAGGSAPARADEAFLCGPDKITYVKSAELEQKKKSDPCIARYFGLEAEKPADPADKSLPGPFSDASSAKPLALKSLEAPETAERRREAPERTALAAAPVAVAGTDFRNVRVINASSPSEQWFRHTR